MIGPPLGEHRRREDVGGAGHRRAVRSKQVDAGAAKPPRRAHDATVFQSQLGAEGGQAAKMEIDRAVADFASAGQRHDRPAAPRQQRPEHAESGPQAAHHVVARLNHAAVDGRQNQAVAMLGDVHAQVA